MSIRNDNFIEGNRTFIEVRFLFPAFYGRYILWRLSLA